LLAITAVGVVLAVVRYAGGIGSVANINNAYPWGWWVGFGIMTMIALGWRRLHDHAAGGDPRQAPLPRAPASRRAHGPALLRERHRHAHGGTRPAVEVWMILVSWAPSAALYEVGWCAFLYLNVLVLEFAQVPLEELGWGRALKVLRVIYIPIMLLGVTLSHLHQSSLGTLLTLIPHKINALWWSDQLPLIFLFSAMMAGPAMAILEHLAAARWLGFPPNMDMLAGLARIEAWLVGLLLVFRIGDLVVRGAVDAALSGTSFAASFWVEIGFGLLLPLVLLMMPEVRESRAGLATACSLVVAGVLLHRLNVAVFGLRVRHWETYVPSLGEIGITLGIAAGAVFVFGVLVRILPIHEERPPASSAPESRAAAPAAAAWHGARGVS
jgi:Ni/Fe-hydrogenase subunit HybB-like protein